jgi:hypothetical protein
MKFVIALTALLSSVVATASSVPEIAANSPLGQNLLNHARRLDQNEPDYTWMSGYSIKFVRCCMLLRVMYCAIYTGRSVVRNSSYLAVR